MATAFTASGVASGVQARTNIPGAVIELVSYSLTAAFVVNDTVAFLVLPANARLWDIALDVDPLDTTTGIVIAAGTSASPSLFISGATIGRSSASGVQRANVGGTVNYTSTTDQTLVMKVTTAPTSGLTTGTVRMGVVYTMSANSNS
jgi:hypothetical protein